MRFINFGKNFMMIETASFNGFLKTLFYIIAFWYIFRFLARLFLPMLVKKAVNKASQNFNRQHNPYQNEQQRTNDSITVDTSRAQKSKEKKKIGEYVEYEELD